MKNLICTVGTTGVQASGEGINLGTLCGTQSPSTNEEA